ncbi:MAG TPA: 6-phosphogluconolactonase [Blastocatellia bacterium]|nr:6-phosphogluconolactonase [Blastocatellia bacterium]
MSHAGLIERVDVDRLQAQIFASPAQASAAAAAAAADELRRLIAARGRAGVIFTGEPTHAALLDSLVAEPAVEWTRVVGFHLGEYLGLDETAPGSQRQLLLERLVCRVPMAEFHGLRGEAANPTAVCANYAARLASRPPDLALLDIGPRGRLALIDPAACDFDDPAAVRLVALDEPPRRALSLTIPTVMKCPRLIALALGPGRQGAVRAALAGMIGPACPASILRRHPAALLFLDRDSAPR